MLAKLVYHSNESRVDKGIVSLMGIINQLITGGHHLVVSSTARNVEKDVEKPWGKWKIDDEHRLLICDLATSKC